MLEDNETSESEGESATETDETEQDNKEQLVYRATASESYLTATATRESLIPSKSVYLQQKQISSAIRSSAESDDVWLSSDVVSDRTSSHHYSPSVEPRRRTVAHQMRDGTIQERQQKLSLSYRPRYTEVTLRSFFQANLG